MVYDAMPGWLKYGDNLRLDDVILNDIGEEWWTDGDDGNGNPTTGVAGGEQVKKAIIMKVPLKYFSPVQFICVVVYADL